jgi:hypothetical protein
MLRRVCHVDDVAFCFSRSNLEEKPALPFLSPR